ncbi:uncharacterized protein LOC107019620 [Solanum pennellii]|uniref:Uncharacterized protein LOC107019620 n=1 Tax=Solanum pennellii TaxID=28526 RepID=A0ABM1GSY7_SOLPN|nr:uncharacterized protein LOC107019620 [Solanum pennellii]
MAISHLMVYSQHVEEARAKRTVEMPKGQDLLKMSNPKPNKGKDTRSTNKKPTCAKCGKGHLGECLVGTKNCFRCGKSGHKVRDCPNIKVQEKGSGQTKASGSKDAPKKNDFYALCSRGEKETFSDVMNGMSFPLMYML